MIPNRKYQDEWKQQILATIFGLQTEIYVKLLGRIGTGNLHRIINSKKIKGLSK